MRYDSITAFLLFAAMGVLPHVLAGCAPHVETVSAPSDTAPEPTLYHEKPGGEAQCQMPEFYGRQYVYTDQTRAYFAWICKRKCGGVPVQDSTLACPIRVSCGMEPINVEPVRGCPD